MPGYEAAGGGGQRSGGGGVPDGLLLGALGLLLSSTVLVWSATGLSALLAHGSWPSGVSVRESALAVRALLGEPGDPAAAWPDADADALARPGLFWGVLVGQLMLLFTFAVMAMGAIARRRLRRAERRAARAAAGRATTSGAAVGRAASDRETRPDVPTHSAPVHSAPGEGPEGQGDLEGLGGVEGLGGLGGLGDVRKGAGEADREGTPRAARESMPEASHDASRQASHATPQQPGPRWTEPVNSPAPEVSSAVERAATEAPAVPGLVGAPALGYGSEVRTARTPAEALAEATGPALVVTADPTLWSETVGARGKLGPTHLYDPSHAADAPVRLRWSPERGCHDMETAAARAAALLAPVRSPAKIDEATHDTAVTLLRCALHAAAVDGQPFKQAHRWTTVAGSANDAVRILRKHKSAHSGAAGELEAALIGYPERRDEATALIRHAFDCLAQLHVRNSCTASKADVVALESFVSEGGTLYVVGESREDPRRDPGAMPLATALTTYVVELGRRMAARSSSGRLDPPMTVVLDAPATVAPLPALPALLTEGATYGLHTHAFHRSPDQAHAWWPELRAGV